MGKNVEKILESAPRRNKAESFQEDRHGPNFYPEEEDVPGREFWGGSGWQKYVPENIKRNKGQKRRLWLASQIESLKADGRWIGDAPSAAAKKIRLAKDHAAILCFGIFICSC